LSVRHGQIDGTSLVSANSAPVESPLCQLSETLAMCLAKRDRVSRQCQLDLIDDGSGLCVD
jgi:hypothetical protein